VIAADSPGASGPVEAAAWPFIEITRLWVRRPKLRTTMVSVPEATRALCGFRWYSVSATLRV